MEKHKEIFFARGFSQVEEDHVAVVYISTKEQDADILKKAMLKSKFEFHRDGNGVENNPFLVEREC